jgi:atypical dual specificity phosphatase
MHSPSPADICVVFFNKSVEDCCAHVTTRVGHPTISGEGLTAAASSRIIQGFYKRLVAPSTTEGFERVEVVTAHDDAHALLRSGLFGQNITPIEISSSIADRDGGEIGEASPTPTLFRFPRTTHLMDAGGSGVTRDDLVMTADEASDWLGCSRNLAAGVEGKTPTSATPRTPALSAAAAATTERRTLVTIEEKIDGSNLGISLAPDYTPLFQNRSHFVGAGSGTQWSGLDRWWSAHSQVLTTVLEPRRHVLFGEWMALKHSIHYLHLPAIFVAFDIYDSVEGRFFSRRRFHEFLEPTGIPTVPAIETDRAFTSVEEILPLLNTVSVFGAQQREGPPIRNAAAAAAAAVSESGENSKDNRNKKDEHGSGRTNDGYVEGVYLRVDDGDWLARRCKVVRPDFVQGITEHWSKMVPVKNQVAY